MNLRALKPNFTTLSNEERLELIRQIREHRILVTTKTTRVRREIACKSTKSPKHHKQAAFALDNLTPEAAAQLLKLFEDDLKGDSEDINEVQT